MWEQLIGPPKVHVTPEIRLQKPDELKMWSKTQSKEVNVLTLCVNSLKLKVKD